MLPKPSDYSAASTEPPRKAPQRGRWPLLASAVLASALAGGILLKYRGSVPPIVALSASLRVPEPLHHEWRLLRDKHWQIVSSPSESRSTTDELEGTRGECPTGMVEVKGRMKQDPSPNPFSSNTIEELQKTTCKKWIQREYPERCAEFDRDKWLAMSKELAVKPMQFCIDRFEYPNQKGVYPAIMISWHEAAGLCSEQGKRLCNEAEWTFACEGEEAMPYPYGYIRDPDNCVVDKQWRPFNEKAMLPRNTSAAMAEMDRLWQGVPSGTQPKCRSPFGVYDMTGNIDEWTRSAREQERPSILKGGYWGPVRTRCRPSTRSHDESHTFYQQGLRCCTDVGVTLVDQPVGDDPSTAPLPRELR